MGNVKTFDFYALDRLDELISNELNPASIALTRISPDLINKYTQKVKSEILLIRKYLWSTIELVKNKKQLHILILQYQHSLSSLLDLLKEYDESFSGGDDQKDDLRKIYERIGDEIIKILSFIEFHYCIWIRLKPTKKDFFLHT